jgi:hypothetical protein
MQFYLKIPNFKATFAVIYALMHFSCGPGNPDVSDIQVDTKIERFDKELPVMLAKPDAIKNLKAQYGLFYETFTYLIHRIEPGSEEDELEALQSFVSDSSVRSVSISIDSVFRDMQVHEDGINQFARHFKYYFPADTFPRVVSFNSFFNYAVAVDSGFIGLGLDMFLGENSHYYEILRLPLFLRKRMSKDYLVPAAVLGWFNSEYPRELAGKDFLSQMIHQGKSIYFSQKMLPQAHDTLLLAFSKAELEWCEENEERIWSLFIEKKMLFSTDPSLYVKFLGEAPRSSGFPDQAPDRIGVWVGLQIVKKYMELHADTSLSHLIAQKDALKILDQSGYKP